jgi:cobalt-zinc-cadmium efflux system outer membrane protein
MPPAAVPADGAPPAGAASAGDPERADGDALRLAWERHPRMRAARERILATRGFETQAGLWPNPDLAISARREPGEKTFYPVTLAQRFELGGKASSRVETAAAQTFVAESACRETWTDVRAGVKEALVRLAHAREVLRLRKAIHALDGEARDLAESLARAGKAPETAALARTRQWTDLTLFAGVVPINRDDGGWRTGWEGGFSVGLPLWDRGQGEIAGREAMTEAAREERAQAAVATAAGVSRLEAARVEAENEAAGLHDTVLPAARRSAELAASAARAGKAGRAEALAESRALLEQELDLVQARLRRAVAVAGLERVIGSTWDVSWE